MVKNTFFTVNFNTEKLLTEKINLINWEKNLFTEKNNKNLLWFNYMPFILLLLIEANNKNLHFRFGANFHLVKGSFAKFFISSY